MKNSLIISFLIVSTIFSCFSNKKEILSEIYALEPIEINYPLKVDSTNLKGNRFEEKELLKMSVNIPSQESFLIKLNADTSGYFHPEISNKNTANFQLYSFYISSGNYAKGSIKVSSPNMLEIYVNNKLEASKTTTENTLNDAKSASADIKPYPEREHIVIKLLSTGQDSISPALKVEIENNEKDSLSDFTVSNSSKRFVTFKDMRLGKRVTNTRISPNGNYVLISYTNTLGEKSESSIELYNIKKGTRLLIDQGGQKKQLNWLPKSEKMYYVANTVTGNDLITIDPNTLEEKIRIKNVPNFTIRFAPDEQSFFYYKQDNGDEKSGDLTLLQSPRARQGGYLNRSFIYQYNIENGLSQQLTFGSTTTTLNSISADSKQILFSTSEETITERPFSTYSMFKLDLETMQVDTLWHRDPFAYQAIFSPDGQDILIIGAGDAFGGIGLNLGEGEISNTYNRSAFIMNLSTKKIEAITKDFDPSINSAIWNEKNKLIYFKTVDKDFENIYTYNPANKKFTLLQLNEGVVNNFSLSPNATFMSYFGVNLSNSTKAYIYDINKKKSTLVADPYKERLDEIYLGDVLEWNFTNSEDTEIMGRYYLPPNFDASKKYPLIVYYYGGTTPTSRTFERSYPPHVYASLGYIVYVLQPSGAIGFGQKFAAMHVNAWGKRTAEDIIEGTKKFISEHSFINGDKMGCIGASYGGFMTMYLQTQTDMFAAAVSHAGISSISSYWGEGYWGYAYSSAASAFSYPWNNHDLYVNQSPLFNADKIKTPILLTHGTVDTNVPIGESIQMYTALKILGTPVEFLQVKNENHGVANYTRRIEWSHYIMAWFDKWLKDDSSWWDDLKKEK